MPFVALEIKDHIALLKISRENAMNALNAQVLNELETALEQVSNNRDIYCLIITGTGNKAFVAGADINEMKDLDVKKATILGYTGNYVLRKLEKLPIPTIAMVNGYALGGGFELALACDLRFASENAVFAFPEVSLGITPGYGGTQRLPRLIGLSAAKKLMFTGLRIKADEAYRLGAVDGVYPADELYARVIEFAEQITRQAPIAVSKVKAAIEAGSCLDLDNALQAETIHFAQCFSTSDQKKGMEAFINKEKVSFDNK